MKVKVILGDITKINVDAIVNAANTSLLGGSGVDGAIHRLGGSKILKECHEIRYRQGRCKVGKCVITTAGNLPAKFVIHTVGPNWNGGGNGEELLLTNAYFNSLLLADKNKIKSIAFPNISTGIYGFPKDKAANIAISTVRQFLQDHSNLREVTFVCYDKENFTIYNKLI